MLIITPLHKEVLKALFLVKPNPGKKTKAVPLSQVTRLVTITRHASRVRLALESLAKEGLVIIGDYGYILKRGSA